MSDTTIKLENEITQLKEELAKTRAVNLQILAEMANAYKTASSRAEELLQIKSASITKQEFEASQKQQGIFYNKVLALEQKLLEFERTERGRPQPSPEEKK